jgi:hydroxymethylglutaryl-CoA lyase
MVELIKEATAAGLEVRAGLQSAFGCVYEGKIQESDVLVAAEKLHVAGAKEVNLADTSGMATPASVSYLVQRVVGELPDLSISLHLHDTRGLGLANMYSGYLSGVRVFDVCTGGLGGCPFVKGAAGNVPTEDAVNMFGSMGVATGVELERLLVAVEYLEKLLNRRLPGRMKRVYDYQRSCGSEIDGLS